MEPIMAKPLTSTQLVALTQAAKNMNKITRLQVFALAQSGLLDVKDDEFVLTGKAQRAVKRHARQSALQANIPVVAEAALQILDTDVAMCTHRQIWTAVGRDKFDRDDVLDAMRALREEGVLESVKLSGNNFQIMWKRGAAAPALAVPEFVDVTDPKLVAEEA